MRGQGRRGITRAWPSEAESLVSREAQTVCGGDTATAGGPWLYRLTHRVPLSRELTAVCLSSLFCKTGSLAEQSECSALGHCYLVTVRCLWLDPLEL